MGTPLKSVLSATRVYHPNRTVVEAVMSDWRWGCFLYGILAVLIADEPAIQTANPPDSPVPGTRWALILSGIPGDEQHAALFQQTATAWEKWLTTDLQFESSHVLRLPGSASPTEKPAPLTAEVIRNTLADLSTKLGERDALWVFLLGHGNYDGKHAWFHVEGRDPSQADLGRWLSNIRCREQVLWLTQANSGWFVKPLSQPGRIVVAATAADDESNETEFPEALTSVTRLPVEKLDADADGKVSVAEFFIAVSAAVLERFAADNRFPTEHAQLDDNGDGLGTEVLALKETLGQGKKVDDSAEPESDGKPKPKQADGELARQTFLPFRTPNER
ncbi:MAG: hypothetical protein JSS02_19665 [Planctomycetes bacterium]|nr:hypothetical protein [Planctomycetota bacterium]